MLKENELQALKERFPQGARVELLRMEDVYGPPIGTHGTVNCVDDSGTIHVKWDNGSSLGVVYGEDECRVVKETRCPKCGQYYSDPPALSREDNETLICPDCGTREALDSIGASEAKKAEVIATIHAHKRKLI